MHFFYSFLRKSLDNYNEDNAKDENKFFMLNAILMSNVILEKGNDPLYQNINKVWQKYLKLKFLNKDIIKFNMALNQAINLNQDSIFKALGKLSQYQKSGMDSEVYDRKMTWDTYAVEVD